MFYYLVSVVTNLGPVHFPMQVDPSDDCPDFLCRKQVEVDLELVRRGLELAVQDDLVYEEIDREEHWEIVNID